MPQYRLPLTTTGRTGWNRPAAMDLRPSPGRPYRGGPFILAGIWTNHILRNPFISPQMLEYRDYIYTHYNGIILDL